MSLQHASELQEIFSGNESAMNFITQFDEPHVITVDPSTALSLYDNEYLRCSSADDEVAVELINRWSDAVEPKIRIEHRLDGSIETAIERVEVVSVTNDIIRYFVKNCDNEQSTFDVVGDEELVFVPADETKLDKL